MEKTSSNRKMKYVKSILALAIIVLLGFSLYEHFIILPSKQSTINNLRVETFLSWRSSFRSTIRSLEEAEEDSDLEYARRYIKVALQFVIVLKTDLDLDHAWQSTHPNYLYTRISGATYSLWDTLYHIRWPWPSNIEEEIASIATSFNNVVNATTFLYEDGVDLVQQIREKGKLPYVITNLEQIYDDSGDIYRYYN